MAEYHGARRSASAITVAANGRYLAIADLRSLDVEGRWSIR
jgi:hypothetical protein